MSEKLKAVNNQKQFYNNRFQEGYMKNFAGVFEASRLYTIKEILYNMKIEEFNPIADRSFDLIICIEVLEHVKNVKESIKEIGRLLRPNGIVILTTPCSNKYSLEWVINKITNGLQQSFDGYNRFTTDEPAHLRRLNDGDIMSLFSKNDIDIYKIYHRAHFFTTIKIFLTERLW